MSRPLPPAEMIERVRNSVFLAGAVMVAVIPLFLVYYQQLGGLLFKQPLPGDVALDLAAKQSAGMFGLAWLCALTGFLYAHRLGLPGFGKASDIRLWFPVGIGLGLFCAAPVYFMVERSLLQAVPGLYPSEWYQALLEIFAISLSQETILRFGLLTIVLYWFKRLSPDKLHLAAIIPAALNSIGFYFMLRNFGGHFILSGAQMLFALTAVFLAQYLYGEVYRRKGLIAAICLHFGLDIRYLGYALLL